jgi:hypothetical protein
MDVCFGKDKKIEAMMDIDMCVISTKGRKL